MKLLPANTCNVLLATLRSKSTFTFKISENHKKHLSPNQRPQRVLTRWAWSEIAGMTVQ